MCFVLVIYDTVVAQSIQYIPVLQLLFHMLVTAVSPVAVSVLFLWFLFLCL